MRKRKKGRDDDNGSDSDSNLTIDLDTPMPGAAPTDDLRSSSDLASGHDLDSTLPAERNNDPSISQATRSSRTETTEPFLDPLGSYVLVKPTDPEVSFRKINVWAPSKQIEAICGQNIKLEMKALRDGSLLIKTASSRQTKLILKQTTFCTKKVSVSLHQSLNQSKGTIFAPELKFMSEEDLLEGMSDQGVSHVRRITTFRDGQRRDTSLLVLTFDHARLPLKLTCGYLRYDVKPFIPNPLRCFRCQRFGHGKNKCNADPICHRCAQPEHEGTPCRSHDKCANCGGDHASSSKDCPNWQREKQICEIKVNRNITYPEARKIVESQQSNTPDSYASKASKTFSSMDCQTDPVPQLPPLKLLPPLKPTSLQASVTQTTQNMPATQSIPSAESAHPKTSGASSRNSSRGRSPSRKTPGSRSSRETNGYHGTRPRSPRPGSEHRQSRQTNNRPHSVARGAVGPPVGQGQFFS